MAKADQRKRQKAGYEFISALVFKPKLIAWLVREGLLAPTDAGDRPKIIAALETHLYAHYALADVPGAICCVRR